MNKWHTTNSKVNFRFLIDLLKRSAFLSRLINNEEHHIEKIEINDEINTIAILFVNLIVLKYVHYKIEKEM